MKTRLNRIQENKIHQNNLLWDKCAPRGPANQRDPIRIMLPVISSRSLKRSQLAILSPGGWMMFSTQCGWKWAGLSCRSSARDPVMLQHLKRGLTCIAGGMFTSHPPHAGGFIQSNKAVLSKWDTNLKLMLFLKEESKWTPGQSTFGRL